MELDALRSLDRQTSIASLAKLIRRTGSTDALDVPRGDLGSEFSQAVAEDAFVEIQNRLKACGADRYPFEVARGHLRLKVESRGSPYILLLLLSVVKPTAGHRGTAAHFEHLCTLAAKGYLGGKNNNVTAARFGSPRRTPLAKLHQAIDDICVQLAEGGGCSRPDLAGHLGDEGLDIIAWRNFPDAKEGKLIAFGQCAGGAGDWQNKLAEMDAIKFAKKWFRKMLVVDPLRMFFVPRRIPAVDWETSGIDGGILFDRCRIVACLDELDDELNKRSENFTKAILKELEKNR
jgi:hypothetical protein